MSDIVDGANLKSSSGRNTDPAKHEEYQTHNEEVALNSEIYSDSLSPPRPRHSPNHENVVLEEDTAADRYESRLAPVTKELEMVDIELDQIFNSLEEARRNCHREADAIKTAISEATQSIIDLIRKREQELHLEVDQKKAAVMEQIKDTDVRKMELSLSCDNMKGTCEQLKADLEKHDFKRAAVIEILPGKSAILQREVSELKSTLHTGAIGLSYERAPQNTAMPIDRLVGKVEGNHLQVPACGDGVGAGKKELLTELQSIYCQTIIKSNLEAVYEKIPFYNQGFSLLTANSMVLPFLHKDLLFFVWLMGGRSPHVNYITFGEESLQMSPIGCESDNSILVYNKSTIFKVVACASHPYMRKTASVTISNALLYEIRAVCWDEEMKNCYALLHDGRTITFLPFNLDKSEAFQVKLNEKVKYSSPCGFQVSEFGMAICDEKKNEVRYYTSVRSPEATCVVKAPQKIEGARPICVTFRRKSKKWCVVWQKNVNSCSRDETCSIYQYSASLQEEHVLLETEYTISSLGILDDNYMCIKEISNRYSSEKILVYYIESNT